MYTKMNFSTTLMGKNKDMASLEITMRDTIFVDLIMKHSYKKILTTSLIKNKWRKTLLSAE